MERSISDKTVSIIKEMLAKGYPNGAIKATLKIRQSIEVSSQIITQIKKGENYVDVREDLNEKIFAQFETKLSPEMLQIIEGVKFALANEYKKDEILTTYKISPKRLYNIKMLYAPYCNIAPEYNEKIRSTWRRKKMVNIDSKMVRNIKEMYVHHNGSISISEIVKYFKIDKGTISNILNLKTYANSGVKYNPELKKIFKTKQTALKQKRMAKEKKAKIRLKIQNLQANERVIKDRINAAKKELSSVET